MKTAVAVLVISTACLCAASCAGKRSDGPQSQHASAASVGQQSVPVNVIAARETPPAPAPKVALPPEGAHYRVLKTDTAKSIAVKFYGDERYAEYILEMNRETMRRARGLKPGTVILLPPPIIRDTVARP